MLQTDTQNQEDGKDLFSPNRSGACIIIFSMLVFLNHELPLLSAVSLGFSSLVNTVISHLNWFLFPSELGNELEVSTAAWLLSLLPSRCCGPRQQLFHPESSSWTRRPGSGLPAYISSASPASFANRLAGLHVFRFQSDTFHKGYPVKHSMVGVSWSSENGPTRSNWKDGTILHIV